MSIGMKTEPDLLRILSNGLGVQSTTLKLMAEHGEFDFKPDLSLTSDTEREPQGVYDNLAYLSSDNMPNAIPMEVVSRGDLGQGVIDNVSGLQESGKRVTIPAFTAGKGGGAAPLARHCTADFKIVPLENRVRELIGLKKGARWKGPPAVEMWIGISTDEASRMKPSSKPWIVNRWPLIEKGMSRWDCYNWLERHGYPVVRPEEATADRPQWPPKSACYFCPYHDKTAWRNMKDKDPVSWAKAVEFDAAIRSGFEGGNGEVFLHRSLKPLSEVDLTTVEDEGQTNMFIDQCEEGMCGV